MADWLHVGEGGVQPLSVGLRGGACPVHRTAAKKHRQIFYEVSAFERSVHNFHLKVNV